ncbi:MAG: hypothetical protein HQ526_08770 [Actinobacteria bacterium]|nr:hypothetical protein [Actinomycetota bacterium]
MSDLWTVSLIPGVAIADDSRSKHGIRGVTMGAAAPARPSGGARNQDEFVEGNSQHRSPQARRQRIPKAWQQPKFLAGTALVVVSVVIGASLVGSADQRVLVWSTARDLSPGTVLERADLVVSPVQAEQVDLYVGADSEDLIGRSLMRPMAANELVPVSAIGAGRENSRLITVPVEPIHAPTDLAHGDLVDVYVSPRDAATAGGASRMALSAVTVAEVAPDVDSATGEIAVVLEVGAEQAGEVVGASRSGVLDLVRVPTSSQRSSR